MTINESTSSGSPDLSAPSGQGHESADTTDDALSPGSNATGDPTSLGENDLEVDVPRSPANPNSLVEGNRVTGPRDME